MQAVLDYDARHQNWGQSQDENTHSDIAVVDESMSSSVPTAIQSMEKNVASSSMDGIIGNREPVVFGDGLLAVEEGSICDTAIVYEGFDGSELEGGQITSGSDIIHTDNTPTSNPYAYDGGDADGGDDDTGGRAVQGDDDASDDDDDVDVNSSDRMYASCKEDIITTGQPTNATELTNMSEDGDLICGYGDGKEEPEDDHQADTEVSQDGDGDGAIPRDDGEDCFSNSRSHWIHRDESAGNGSHDHDADTNTLLLLEEGQGEDSKVGTANEQQYPAAPSSSSSACSSSSSSSSSLLPPSIKDLEKMLQTMHSQLDRNIGKQSLPVARCLMKALKVKNNYMVLKRQVLMRSGLLCKLRRWLQRAYDSTNQQKTVLKVFALATSATFDFRQLIQDDDGLLLSNLRRLLSEATVDQESRLQVLCILSHLVTNGGLRAKLLLDKEFGLLDILLPLNSQRNNKHCLKAALHLMNNLWLDLVESINTASDDPTSLKADLTQLLQKLAPEAALILKGPHRLSTAQATIILCEASMLLQTFTEIPEKEVDCFTRSHHDRVAMVQACDVFPALLRIDKKIADKLKLGDVLNDSDHLKAIQKLETVVLCLLRDLTSGSDETTEAVIQSGGSDLLAMLTNRLCDDDPWVRKVRCYICNMVKNITAGTAAQCHFVAREAEVVSALLSILEEGPSEDDEEHSDAWRFAAEALLNIVSNGVPSEDRRLVRDICQQVLGCPERDLELIPIALYAMESSLICLDDSPVRTQAMWTMWRDEGAVALLDRLSHHEDEYISQEAQKTASFFSCYENN